MNREWLLESLTNAVAHVEKASRTKGATVEDDETHVTITVQRAKDKKQPPEFSVESPEDVDPQKLKEIMAILEIVKARRKKSQT